MKNTYYGEIVRGNVGPVFKIYNGTFQKLGNFEADVYPIGTRITVTLEEPELPKERIVLPEGMAWKGNVLWFYGASIARVYTINSGGYYCIPYNTEPVYFKEFESVEAGKQIIEAALAEHGYFSVKKGG